MSAGAQQSRYHAFTTKDGLPSNHVYQCVEDDKGFLWVATDAGVARFDGRHFQVFTTEHGVPDNEVLHVLKEKNGTIWINCFKQSPSYFDEAKNRFINASEDSNLAKLTGTAHMRMAALKDGGMMYNNENGAYIFKDKKLYYYNNLFFIRNNPDGSMFRVHRNKVGEGYITYLVHTRKDGAADSIPIGSEVSATVQGEMNSEDFYMADWQRGVYYSFKDIGANPLRYRIDSVVLPGSFFSISFTESNIVILSTTASIYVLDKKNLQLKHVLNGNYLPNNLYDDSRGNLWISTIDKGLLVMRRKSLQQVETHSTLSGTNFISIARKPDGTLLAGNYYGEVSETGKNVSRVHALTTKKPARVKKILVARGKVYAICDGGDGIFENFNRPVIESSTGQPMVGGKTGVICNDTLIMVGATFGLISINPVKGISLAKWRYNRTTAIVKGREGEVYIGSTDGLHHFNYTSNRFTALNRKHALLKERITGLAITPDQLLWVATSSNGIVVVRNDTVLHHITLRQGIVSNSCRSITAAGPGQVWLGTPQGISVINYQLVNDQLEFSSRNLSENDGLTSNEINEMVYHNDTVYAATGNGISVVPVNRSFSQPDIPTHLVAIRINQRDTVISHRYQLEHYQQDIQMRFAGVELNGHFKNLQYSLDDSQTWLDLPDNILTLQLSHGDHRLSVRAVDVNGRISNKVLTIFFEIATPFWKALWFWLVIALVLQGSVFYFLSRWQKKRKEARLSTALARVQTASLEQQAFTSLMNPHFIFNALNSIQYYINVQDRQSANRYLSDFASLIRKNFEASQQSFVPLDQELENTRIYLRLEQMRFKDRFTHVIECDPSVDTDEWMIPSMMIQPLLENAILHGLMPSVIHGELKVSLVETDDSLQITITDNGIGITNSRALKKDSHHKSHGMELIIKRIAALSRFVETPVDYMITTAYDSEKNPGNKTVLRIPRNLYASWLKARNRE